MNCHTLFLSGLSKQDTVLVSITLLEEHIFHISDFLHISVTYNRILNLVLDK